AAEVAALLAAGRAAGRPGVDEARWAAMLAGADEAVAAVLRRDPDRDRLVAYAQVTRGRRRWVLDVAVDPGLGDGAAVAGADVLRAAVAAVRARGGGLVQLWVHRPSPADDDLADRVGLHDRRDLLQLRRPLPADPPPPIDLRPFRPGVDEEAWLAVN